MRLLASARCSRCGATSFGQDALCPACLLRLASLPHARVPLHEIETLLGAHDSGSTYLARAAGTGALLVVKTFDAVVTDPETLDAVETLGARLASFRHPGIARIHGIEADGDAARLVRDYVKGRPFELWKRQAAAPEVAGAIAAIRDAVAALHAQDLAHGHIDPANIVIAGGTPVLLDAGALLISHRLAGRPSGVDALMRDDRSSLEGLT